METPNDKSTNITFGFGMLFLLVALCCTAVAFSTGNWTEIYVDRKVLRQQITPAESINKLEFYTRFRGLFFTCFEDDAKFLDGPEYEDRVDEGRCLREHGYETPTRNPDTVGYSKSYDVRIHLMRTHFAAMILAMIFFVVCIFMGVMSCWRSHPAMMRSSGTLIFVGMFFCGASMALFHGYNYLDSNVLTEVEPTMAWIAAKSQSELNYSYLITNTAVVFGYSYILGWLGLAFSIIAAVLHLTAAFKLTASQDAEFPTKSLGYRNRAYDHMGNSPLAQDPYNSNPRPPAAVAQPAYYDRYPYDYGVQRY